MRGEADHLNGRVVVTENRIAKLGDAVKEDNALTDEAKEKVNKLIGWHIPTKLRLMVSFSFFLAIGWSSKIRFGRIYCPSGEGIE